MNKTELKHIYDLNRALYEKVCEVSKELVKKVLQENKIEILHLSTRVKSFESFFEKISRKQYVDPYGEVEDICGLRIVCFYSQDLGRINKIISENFQLKEFEDKSGLQESDRFGYRANHYIVRLPQLSQYTELDGLKIEVQSRTTLMHTWAHIQGKLEYKKKEHIPENFRRKLYQLSAILELADEQFQTLKNEKDDLRDQLITGDFVFSDLTELNIDTFMSFSEIHFQDRSMNYRYSKLLMKHLIKHRIGFKEILESYDKVNSFLPEIEQEMGTTLSQDEAFKTILSVKNKVFLSSMDEDQLIKDHIKIINKWSEIISKLSKN